MPCSADFITIMSAFRFSIHTACRIVNIAFNVAMILPYNANLGWIDFSEGTG